LWHRKYVDWTAGQLIGRQEGSDREVDFAKQAAVYGLYAANNELVYVGQAGRGCLYNRLRNHALEDDLFCLWKRFSWFGFYSPEQLGRSQVEDIVVTRLALKDALDAIESIAIYLALPRYNLRRETGFQHVA